MIPDTVRSLAEIRQMPGQDERLIHAVSLLDFLLAVSTRFGRGGFETLGAAVNRHEDMFTEIANLNFALGVRNKIAHPRPENAGDPDLYPVAVQRAAGYVLDAIERDIAQYVPPEVGEVLITATQDEAGTFDAANGAPPSSIYVAGWRYEPRPASDVGRAAWRLPEPENDPALAHRPTNWVATAFSTLQNTSSGAFWGVMACVPPAMLIVYLLGSKLNSLLPGNLLVYGAAVFLTVSAVRWLRDA